jgi:hypothetical protein
MDVGKTVADTSEIPPLDLSFLPAWALHQEKQQRQVRGQAGHILQGVYPKSPASDRLQA